MNTIDQVYEDLLNADTDVRAHLPALKHLAAGHRVTEFGVRRGISTCALIAGRPISYVGYDIIREPDVDRIAEWAFEAKVAFAFFNTDLIIVDGIDPTDILFIDAMHNGPAVRRYLRLGLTGGMSVCALHDTEIFGRCGDIVGTDGILDAVDDFLRDHQDWRLVSQSRDDYGFTVIGRK